MTKFANRNVWYALLSFAAVCFISSCFGTEYAPMLTGEVARKLHGRTVGEKENERQLKEDKEYN